MENKKNQLADAQAHDVENPPIPLRALLSQKLKCWKPLSSKPCIYRAPKQLVIKNEHAYTPKVVSIGPIHHGRDGLQLMEEYKQRFFSDFLERTKVQLDDYIRFTRDREAKLRECYEHTIGYGSDELIEIVMVDAAFIVELLLRNFVEEERSCRIFNRPYLIMNIVSDMMLLENQLPMFLLQDLFTFAKIVTKSSENEQGIVKDVSSIQLVCEFINFRTDIGVEKYDLQKVLRHNPEHFLDCLCICQLSGIGNRPVNKKVTNLWIPTAMQLHLAGVKFVKSSSSHLLDIEFNDKEGVLKIPHIFMGNSTEIIYRNLLAFEQCHYIDESYFTHYFSFMARLVDSDMDIDLLVKNGIIENVLGDNEQAANVFNSLAQGLAVSNEFYFADLGERLSAYYKKPWHRRKAILQQDYFNTPWTGISVIAAGVLLFLTIVQTVFSILSFVYR